jgi:hypothetical protein
MVWGIYEFTCEIRAEPTKMRKLIMRWKWYTGQSFFIRTANA